MNPKIYSASSIAVREYTVESPKVLKPVRAAVVADLHSASYGEGGRELISLIKSLSPDLALFPGDTDDGVKSAVPALRLVESLAMFLPCFLVLGNHELLLRREKRIAAAFKAAGAVVLNGESTVFTAKSGQAIRIAGVFDHWCRSETRSSFKKNLAKAQGTNDALFSLLLSHRPELHGIYKELNFDMTVCGHAHGGQWRVGPINGVWAPGQGLLPKYAGGLYEISKGRHMLVSRGLALGNTWVPRFGNPPELPVLSIIPQNTTVDKTE